MKQLDQRGEADKWFVAFLLSFVLLVASLGFGGWAFMGRSDYKNNVDAKISDAVEAANKELSAKKDAEFAEKEKSPVKSYTGPAAYASVAFTYPKTWSAYVDETSKGGTAVVASYFHPNIIPGFDSGTNYALRMQILNNTYTSQVAGYNQATKSGKVKISAYKPAKVAEVTGVRVEGEIFTKKQGYMIMVPIRDKTLKVWTESSEYAKDLDNIVLPSLTFVP